MADVASRDSNDVPTLLGVSNADGSTVVKVYADPNTHRLLVDASGAAGTAVYGEVVAGNNTAWTLANTPLAGTVRLYANGQRLAVTTDYTIAGAAITTILSWASGTILADYAY